ncbi:MAG: FlgD immunoglobulin-like domain containing protein [Candidatus Poribacteria bacterium]
MALFVLQAKQGSKAYVIGMASAKEVTFAGVGWNNRLFLSEGNNFIAVPRVVKDWRLSDLATHIGADVSAIFGYDVASGQFVKYEPSAPVGSPVDIPVKGGAGYLVVMKAPATVEFDGPTWQNSGAEAIPPIVSRERTPFLLIEGTTTSQGIDFPLDGLSVSIRNLGNDLQRADMTGHKVGDGRYSVVFADFVENRAAQVGDALHITITDPKAAFGAKVLTYQLTPEDIQRGVVSLDFQLSSTPAISALLSPYPNPSNPEVWMPYQLAKPADVTIGIYDVRGRLVHTLDVGRRPAGIYMGKNEAVHWDGKNLQGEKVANGIYFYSIHAGVFTATGKLVLLSK